MQHYSKRSTTFRESIPQSSIPGGSVVLTTASTLCRHAASSGIWLHRAALNQSHDDDDDEEQEEQVNEVPAHVERQSAAPAKEEDEDDDD
jgi:hypothetical protein